MDGSAKPFVNIFNKAKKVKLNKKRKYLKITEKVSLEKNGRKFQLNQMTFSRI